MKNPRVCLHGNRSRDFLLPSKYLGKGDQLIASDKDEFVVFDKKILDSNCVRDRKPRKSQNYKRISLGRNR